MISFQFGVEQHAPCNVIGMTEVFHWSVIDGVIVGSPCDTPQQALEEAVNVLHRTKPYQLEHWLADHIDCLNRVLVEQPERQSDANLNDELSRYKALHNKVVNYRALCSSLSTA